MPKSIDKLILSNSSFRDKSNFVFEYQGNIFRAFTPESFKTINRFINSKLYVQLEEENKIISSKIFHSSEIDLPKKFEFIVKHKKLDNITYKDTWTFNMLKDAALLTLDFQEKLLLEGFSLKDASVFNVQFINSQPIFIDLGSIIEASEEVFWSGYRQFIEMFLNPLTISSSLQINLQDFYMYTTRGINSETAWKMLKLKDKIKLNNIINIKIQINRKKTKINRLKIDKELESAGFTIELRIKQIKKLKKVIKSLKEPLMKSNWLDYSQRSHYESREIDIKKQFIKSAFTQKKYEMIIDWGCNDGLFSEFITLQSSAVRCIALDFDPQVIDKLYLRSKENRLKILPLVFDISNPPVDYGLENLERQSFSKFINVDLNLAYALVHHLFISENIPWNKIIGLFVNKGDLIIEFPLPEDTKVIELLNLKKNPQEYLEEYNIKNFEDELKKNFEIINKTKLNSRILYYCKNLNVK